MLPERRSALGFAPPPGEDDNTAWLLTFSDLVLQLFAFVLVAVVLGGAGRPATAVLRPVTTPEPPAPVPAAPTSGTVTVEPGAVRSPPPAPAAPSPGSGVDTPDTARELGAEVPAHRMAALAAAMREVVEAAGGDDAVTVTVRDTDLIVALSDRITFPSGSADLLPDALPILAAIRVRVSALSEFAVSVEGHTDDVPIHTAAFPSNLELSLARAARVARELIAGDPELAVRTAAAGFGEHHPAASNAAEDGRAQNRRVEIRLMPRERPAA